MPGGHIFHGDLSWPVARDRRTRSAPGASRRRTRGSSRPPPAARCAAVRSAGSAATPPPSTCSAPALNPAGAPGPGARRTVAPAPGVRERLVGRDLALIAAGLTFYAGIAVVPLLVLAFALTAGSPHRRRSRRWRHGWSSCCRRSSGAPDAVGRLVDAGVGLALLHGVLALLPMSLYGEGLRRALLRFSPRRRGAHRLARAGRRAAAAAHHAGAALPAAAGRPAMARPGRDRGPGARRADRGRLLRRPGRADRAAGLGLPGGRRRPGALDGAAGRARCSPRPACRASCRASCCSCPCRWTSAHPFGGLTVVGGVVAVGFWLFLLHLVVLIGWLLTQSLDDAASSAVRIAGQAAPAGRRGAGRRGC